MNYIAPKGVQDYHQPAFRQNEDADEEDGNLTLFQESFHSSNSPRQHGFLKVIWFFFVI